MRKKKKKLAFLEQKYYKYPTFIYALHSIQQKSELVQGL